MIMLRDFHGRDIRLTDERLAHILEHPEMQGQEQRIAETLLTPDSVILSHRDSTVHLYHKLFDQTPVTRKYLVVAVKYLDPDAFVLTAFFTDKEKKGVRIWPP
ncbi:hypothetical protein HYR99_03090 [Candidatus Poribacteria bacterium]|nr:hypothetical protein [Candidatus Poribacteria bacterium]